MGAGSGAALKFLQWFIRGVQWCCAALVLSVFSYFLATLHNHDLPTETWVRAVEGISGIAVVYTAIALLLLCCFAGHTVTSFLAIALDVCFIGGFIYIAAANRGGGGSCYGFVNTPFGSGDAATNVVDDGHGGFTALPNLHQACQLESACLAVSIVAIFFFIFSILVEVALARHHRRERRLGPSPANNYTSGYGSRRMGFLTSFRRRRAGTANSNALPVHTQPDQLRNSHATEQTRVGSSHTGEKKHLDHAAAAAAADRAVVHNPESTYTPPKHGHGDPVTAVGAPGERGTHYDQGVVPAHTQDLESGTGGHHFTGAKVAPSNSVATAHFPPGNYGQTYDDGVYNTRH